MSIIYFDESDIRNDSRIGWNYRAERDSGEDRTAKGKCKLRSGPTGKQRISREEERSGKCGFVEVNIDE